MDKEKFGILNDAEVTLRALKCIEEDLDFVSLKPLPKDITVGHIHHDGYGSAVPTLYVTQPVK